MKLEKSLTCDNINQKLYKSHYAVMGPTLTRAVQIERELTKGVSKPFARVIRAHLGDVQAMGRPPITFIRQVLALVVYPQLAAQVELPTDVRQRAQELLDDCLMGTVGAFSPPSGLRVVRSQVARYLETRDGVPAFAEDIHIGSGASDLVRGVLNLFSEHVDGKPPSVMLPVPQYPLFSASLTELGLKQADYYLDEDMQWALTVEELERCWTEASEHTHVRVLVIINPGNPTGQILSRTNIESIIKFAYEHNLFLLVDEVFQESLITKPFYSFKKIMYEMGAPYSSMEMASISSCSKGWATESGLRCGFMELVGLAPEVIAAFQNVRNILQCPSVLGQCALYCVVNRPRPGEPSYELFNKELTSYYKYLSERAATAYSVFSSIPGYHCHPIEGSTFVYPRVDMPQRALDAAAEAQLSPDEFYCTNLLEQTGICVVPGTGFGQRPGTYHYRSTILNPEEDFQYMIENINKFHHKFLEQYS